MGGGLLPCPTTYPVLCCLCPGSEASNSSRRSRSRPFSEQMGPSEAQSVVTGRTKVTSSSEPGYTCISRRMFLFSSRSLVLVIDAAIHREGVVPQKTSART